MLADIKPGKNENKRPAALPRPALLLLIVLVLALLVFVRTLFILDSRALVQSSPHTGTGPFRLLPAPDKEQIGAGIEATVSDRSEAKPGPCPSSPGQHCWELRNERVRAVFTDYPEPQWHTFEDLAGKEPTVLPIGGSPLIKLVGAASTAKAAIKCSFQNVTHSSRTSLRISLHCGADFNVEFFARLPRITAHYVRFGVKIWASTKAAQAIGALVLFRFGGVVKAALAQSPELDRSSSHGMMSMASPIDGVPVLVEDHFFVGVEHPMALHAPIQGDDGNYWNGLVGLIVHVQNLQNPTADSPWEYGAVFGAVSEKSQARRAFVSYLHAERPGRRTPMVHYNSWYDFYSYQDEGWNGGFVDHHKDPELIGRLRPDKMNETNCLERVNAFGHELVEQRGATIDSFLWDDGWDDPDTLWEFDKARFPKRFDPVSSKATSYGSGTGVWLSPWGGYGFTQEARIKNGKQHGWEVNWNERTECEGFSLAGPNYRKAFSDVALRMVREQAVNMFKFDGVAGDPRELAVEMEAMLKLILDLRKSAKGVKKSQGKGKGKTDESDEIWINLTTGTWASPFFLLWADSIWRGAGDIPGRPTDWEPDTFRRYRTLDGSGGRHKEQGDGLSRRQRWIRWRNLVTHTLVVEKSSWFPISQLMIHGVIVASHGDALHWGLDKFDYVDFAQEVWSFVGLGLQLQELYVAPRHMTPQAWDVLAEGLRWARRESAVLQDSHWAFGDPQRREVYCVASWDVPTARGFIFLANPLGIVEPSQAFTLERVLELPAAQMLLPIRTVVVKSIARWGNSSWNVPAETRQGLSASERWSGWGCNLEEGLCDIDSRRSIQFELLPTEVLILEVSLADQRQVTL